MLNKFLCAGLVAAAALGAAAPAVAQSPAADARFRAAQDRFDREYRIYRDEVARYQAQRGPGPYRGPTGYDRPDEEGPYYDPAPDYRPGPQYRERTLATDDRVYAGEDGRYYCKRSDGTTGLIVGAAGGGILGNVIDGGHSRTVGTLLGGALGALAGRSIDQNNSQVRCR